MKSKYLILLMKMKFILVLSIFVVITCNLKTDETDKGILDIFKNKLKNLAKHSTSDLWEAFHKIHPQKYSQNSTEGLKRLEHFKQHVAYIQEHAKKNKIYQLAIGPFSDKSFEEFKSLSGAIQETPASTKKFRFAENLRKKNTKGDTDTTLYNNSYDWSSLYSDVRNQGSCGSCWAFAATGALEGIYAKNGKTLSDHLSPQYLLDCNTDSPNKACSGGTLSAAYTYITSKSIYSDTDYPYTSTTDTSTKTCSTLSGKTTYAMKSKNSCDGTGSLSSFLTRLSAGPMAVYVKGANKDLQNYSSGIWTPTATDCAAYDHAVVAVGWGEENGVKYIKIRNSWGDSWGEKGYFRVKYDTTSNYSCWTTYICHQPTLS
jgi:C1A family cysteine protease